MCGITSQIVYGDKGQVVDLLTDLKINLFSKCQKSGQMCIDRTGPHLISSLYDYIFAIFCKLMYT